MSNKFKKCLEKNIV